METTRDFKGRLIRSRVHLSNCLIYAVVTAWMQGGRVRMEASSTLRGLPHFYVALPSGARLEFVWGRRGWRAPWVLFLGYGVEVPRAA